jgi:cell division protein FtsW
VRDRNAYLQRRNTSVKTAKSRFNFSGLAQGLHRQLFVLVLSLFGLGALMVYSASAVIASGEDKSSFHYFLLQLVWLTAALVVMLIAYLIPLKTVQQSSVAVMLVSIVFLVLVLLIGKASFGARRWIDLGPFDLQPSEIAKLGFTIYLSAWLARKRPVVKRLEEAIRLHFYQDLLPFMLLLGMVCALIILQPDLDTAVIIALTALAVYFVSGTDAIHTLGTIFIVATSFLLAVFAAVAAPYRLERVQTFISFLLTGNIAQRTGAGFQLWNGLVAISSGGLLGLGYGESRQKLFYLSQAAFTDSIFAVFAEEFGLVGSVLLILAFMYFLSLGINIARNAPDKFSSLLALGITTWISVQAFLNIGANLAIVPFGGIPLPFLSYGGSNTITIALGVGLLLNIHRHSKSATVKKY